MAVEEEAPPGGVMVVAAAAAVVGMEDEGNSLTVAFWLEIFLWIAGQDLATFFFFFFFLLFFCNYHSALF